jgi:hypothetical protein
MTQVLKLSSALFEPIRRGLKKATIRNGKRDIEPGPLTFETPDDVQPYESVDVDVLRVSYLAFGSLNTNDAALEGVHLSVLKESMKMFYPDISPSNIVTLIEFVSSSIGTAVEL